MALRTQLQIEDVAGAGVYAFDVEGEWIPSVQPVYKEAADPPELAELRHTWEFRNCRIVSSDGTHATLWDNFQAFLALFQTRTNQPTFVQLVRDPDNAAVVEWKLDGSVYEQLRFELIEGNTDEHVPHASWFTIANLTIRVSAVRKFVDANGIVDFSQRVITSYTSGLKTLEWQTRIVTASDTSAVAKAQTYAAIDITALSAGYAYQTNGPYGIDYEVLDADEGANRVPTIVEAVSAVREFNASIGASGGGTAPDEVEFSVTTTVEKDSTITTTEAFARGPNAEQWVLGKKPANVTESEVVDRSSHNEYRGRWSREVKRGTPQARTTLKVALSGGLDVVKALPIPGHLPLLQRGAKTPWLCVVEVEVRNTGGTGINSELPLPSLLPEPWHLTDRDEGEPVLEKAGTDASQSKWVRGAKLSYVSATAPTASPLEFLRTAPTVASYTLEA